jgi:hypothetical protein
MLNSKSCRKSQEPLLSRHRELDHASPGGNHQSPQQANQWRNLAEDQVAA